MRYKAFCTCCGCHFTFNDGEICVMPYPHVDCPNCNTWVALY